MPPYACACCNVLASAYISDKFKRRGYVNAFNYLLAIIGFTVLETTTTPRARYVGTFFAATGAFSSVPITLAWNANNIQGSPTKRAVGIAFQTSASSFGGIIGCWMYDPSIILLTSSYLAADAPEYRKGHAVMIGLNALSFTCIISYYVTDSLIVTWIMIFWLKHENAKGREPGTEDAGPEPHRYII